MVFEAQDQRVIGPLESVRFYGVNDDFAEGDFRGQRPPVVNDGLAILAVPTVELHATAPFLQSLDVGVDAARPRHLVGYQVSVVGRGDPVVAQRLFHVLVHHTALTLVQHALPLGEHHELGKPLHRKAGPIVRRFVGLDELAALILGGFEFLLREEEALEVSRGHFVAAGTLAG